MATILAGFNNASFILPMLPEQPYSMLRSVDVHRQVLDIIDIHSESSRSYRQRLGAEMRVKDAFRPRNI